MIPAHLVDVLKLRPLTLDDLKSIPDDRLRYEILQGELIVSEPPGTLHQRTFRKLLVSLDDAVQEADIGEVIPGPFAVELTRFDVVLPDLIVVHRDQREQLVDERFIGAPFLVTEIVCPESARVDYIRKAAAYARARVPEYLIVDPFRRQILDHRSTSDGTTRGRYAAGTVASSVVPGFSLPFHQLFSDQSEAEAIPR